MANNYLSVPPVINRKLLKQPRGISGLKENIALFSAQKEISPGRLLSKNYFIIRFYLSFCKNTKNEIQPFARVATISNACADSRHRQIRIIFLEYRYTQYNILLWKREKKYISVCSGVV